MFKSLRVRLTIWFVCLSAIAYVITTVSTGILFHHQLNRAIDLELTELLGENLQNVHYENGALSFMSAAPTLHTKPIKLLASIQLFDANGHLVHASGAQGVPKLIDATVEVPMHKHHLRSRSRTLFDEGKPVGYLQIQLPTDQREQAERDRFWMLLLTAPILICLLAGAGYYFTDLTTRPMEQAFSTLRDFMSHSGHELNTPLSVAQAVIDNLDHPDTDLQPVLKKKIGVLRLSLDRMRNLVNDLILLAKLDADKTLQPTHELIPFHSLLSECLEHAEILFQEQHINLHVKSLADAWVEGNSSQLQQMVMNLVQNAITYNKPGGEVSIDLSTNAGKVVLNIADTGIGIPSDALDKVFQRFYRVDTSRSRETGGSGLGLSIVQAVVNAHQGEIDIKSEVNAGTIISITLPRAAAPAGAVN